MKKFRDDSDEENYAVHAEDLRVRVKREAEVAKCPQQSPFERSGFYERPLPAPTPVIRAPSPTIAYSSVRLSPPPSPVQLQHPFQRIQQHWHHPVHHHVQQQQPLVPIPRRVEGRHLVEAERNAYFRHPAFEQYYKPAYEHHHVVPEVATKSHVISGHLHNHHAVATDLIAHQGHYQVKASPAESCVPPSFVSPGRPESAFTPFSPASTVSSSASSYVSSESADELEVGVEGQTVLSDNVIAPR